MTKKTILHISNAHSSFDTRIYYNELVSLSSYYDCYLISGGDSNGMLTTMGTDTVPSGIYNNINIIPFPVKNSTNIIIRLFRKIFPLLYRGIYNYICFKKLLNICKKYGIKPVIIHFHDLDLSAIADKMKKYFNSKLIFDCHEFYFSYHFDKGLTYLNLLKASRSLIALKKSVRNADAVISVTKNLDNIISLMKKNDNHIIIYNSSTQPITIQKPELEDRIVLVHEGFMRFNRGLGTMLDLFTDTFLRTRIKLKIVGSISGKENIFFEKKKKDYQIDDSMIEITGWIPYEKLYQYLTGHIGIIFFEKTFNAYYSMPNKLFSYINAAMPILSTHCAELSDFISYNKIGCIVERNINSIKEGLNELITNYDYYFENIKNIQQSYTWKNDEKKLLELYSSLIVQ